jgi:Uma2 family endonuclease
LSQGNIKVLEMATTDHQDIVGFLYRKLFLFVETNQLGKVSFAPLPVKLEDGTFREPDVLFMQTENLARVYKQFWQGADLVMEVVSSDRAHDFEIKREEYPRGGIAEYWIVDPVLREITVLKLTGTVYDPAGVYRQGDRAVSVLLPGFSVDVTAVFDAK